jgi:hypothetical protein
MVAALLPVLYRSRIAAKPTSLQKIKLLTAGVSQTNHIRACRISLGLAGGVHPTDMLMGLRDGWPASQ